MKYLAALAMLPILVGPSLASHPCFSCAQKKVVRPKIAVKEKVVVVNVPTPYPVPYYQPQQFVATIFPQPTYNTNVTVQTPTVSAPQAVQFQVTQPGAVVAPQAVAASAVQNDRLAMILERLDKRLCRLEENAGFANGNEAVKADAGIPKVLATKCAVCHNATSATADGGGFVLFDKGSLAPLSERQLRLIGTKTYSGAMPPKNNKHNVVPLTDQEVADVQAWIAGQK